MSAYMIVGLRLTDLLELTPHETKSTRYNNLTGEPYEHVETAYTFTLKGVGGTFKSATDAHEAARDAARQARKEGLHNFPCNAYYLDSSVGDNEKFPDRSAQTIVIGVSVVKEGSCKGYGRVHAYNPAEILDLASKADAACRAVFKCEAKALVIVVTPYEDD